MATRLLNGGGVIISTISSLAVAVAAALAGSDAATGAGVAGEASESFFRTAEHWGLWAAVSVTLTAIATIGLIYMIRFTLLRMTEAIDDNTAAFLFFGDEIRTLTLTLSKQPCLVGAGLDQRDDDAAEEPEPLAAARRRLAERRADRDQQKRIAR